MSHAPLNTNPKGCSFKIGTTGWIAVSLVAGGAVVLPFYFQAPSLNAPPESKPMKIQGEPISSSRETNTANGRVAEEKRRKKRYPKPASFQQRMVEYEVSQGSGSDQNATQSFAANPAKVVFTRAQLAALPETPLPPGCQRVGFDTLAAFKFEVTKEMADGSANPALASALTKAQLPANIKALDNKTVAIRGFLLPLKMDEGLAVEFLLMRDQNLCCFGAVPKINEWINVRTEKGVKPVMDQPITVIGRLRVGEIRKNGYLTGIYSLEAEKTYAL